MKKADFFLDWILKRSALMLVVASFLACLKDDFLGSVTDFVSRFAYPCFLKRVGLFLQLCWKRPVFPVI